MRKVKVKFHSSLQKFTNGVIECTVDADSYVTLAQACFSLFPALEIAAKKCYHDKKTGLCYIANKKLVEFEDFWLPPKLEVTMLPILSGSGSQYIIIAAMIIIAIAAIATGQVYILAAEAAAASAVAGGGAAVVAASGSALFASYLVSFGVGLLLGGIGALIGLLTAPKAKGRTSDADSRENAIFGPLKYTNSQTNPVPLVYGYHRVAGHYIGSHLRTIEHDKITEVKVIDQVY